MSAAAAGDYALTGAAGNTSGASSRAAELFNQHQLSTAKHVDHLFAWLMILQWFAAVLTAVFISPGAWPADSSSLRIHIWTAVALGALVTTVPVAFAWTNPGQPGTRHTIAIGQMLMSAVLIFLTGGHIETHSHVFASLALLAFYRDWRILISAAVVACADHLLCGFLWPQSVYGITSAPVLRSIEHIGWIIFAAMLLMIAIRKSASEMLNVSQHQADLEARNQTLQRTATERADELTRAIAGRREAEDTSQKNRLQLARAQRIAHLGMWDWDLLADKVFFSEETARLYGFAPDQTELTMDVCLQRVHPEDIDSVREALDLTIRTGQPYDCDHRVVLPDGKERVMHARGEVRFDDIGKVIQITGTTQDITRMRRSEEALRRSEEQLRQAQKMEAIGRLAGGVAHDFNNLLTVITGYCAMLGHKIKPDDPLRLHADQIQRAAERASGLTRQLLAFGRKQVLQPRVVDLSEIVVGMEKMLHRLIGEDIELKTICDPHSGRIEADPGQIEQVILNMAVNARDAMPQGGKLTVRISNVSFEEKTVVRNRSLAAGDYVMIAISDTGVGMTPEVRAHLFEPFFTTKGVGKGSGLGLATCYGIVSQSGGDIRVYSEPGSGTTFKIYLPRSEKHRTPHIPDPDAHTLPAGSERILIVEDDEAVRNLAHTVLAQCGYTIELATDGAEALSKLDKDINFQLVVTDVIMPRVSGRQLYDHVKKSLPDTKVLFISGYTDDALATRGVLEHGFHFLEKPFSPFALARQVRNILDNSEHDTMFRRIATRVAS